MNKTSIVAFCMIGITSACASVSLPATGQTSDGKQWSGYFTIQEFTLAGAGVVCKGATPKGTQKVQQATFTCDDGRTGVATTNRTHLSGGTVQVEFSDGTTGSFVYGT